jgi:hypothetical protein
MCHFSWRPRADSSGRTQSLAAHSSACKYYQYWNLLFWLKQWSWLFWFTVSSTIQNSFKLLCNLPLQAAGIHICQWDRWIYTVGGEKAPPGHRGLSRYAILCRQGAVLHKCKDHWCL